MAVRNNMVSFGQSELTTHQQALQRYIFKIQKNYTKGVLMKRESCLSCKIPTKEPYEISSHLRNLPPKASHKGIELGTLQSEAQHLNHSATVVQ